MTTVRRTFLKNSAAAAVAAVLPSLSFAQTPVATRREFAPQSSPWRTFEVTTRVDIVKPVGATAVWLPVPTVNSDYQQSQESSFYSNGAARMTTDGKQGVKMLMVEFAADQANPLSS